MEFTISELEEKTGLNRRTIHFYVKKEGVISPPLGNGWSSPIWGGAPLSAPADTRNAEFLPETIRCAGDPRSNDIRADEDIADMSPPSIARNKQLFESWLADELQSGNERHEERIGISMTKAWNFSFLDIAKGMASTSTGENGFHQPPFGHIPTKNSGQGRNLERIEIAEGVEVHLRSDLASKYRHMIVELADRIRNKS